jgi:hypothetical protein
MIFAGIFLFLFKKSLMKNSLRFKTGLGVDTNSLKQSIESIFLPYPMNLS